MARMGTIATRAEALLGTAVVATTPVAGGDICTSTRLRLSDGRSGLIKTRPHAPDNFFETEGNGLRWLRDAGGASVPEVLAAADDCLIVAWIEPGR
ncbi:MAG: fructosamine kinase family protein, partial [Longimicrobiales bacterium]